MKKIITLLSLFIGTYGTSQAQAVNDVVSTNAGYALNVWYSLENDEQASSPNSNWDFALATTIGQSNSLTTSILFNHKIGHLYEVPGTNGNSFSTADSIGLSTWAPLYNSDTTWSLGAFNNTTNQGTFDYGWGTYDFATHSGIYANRIFIIKYTNGSCKKLKIDLTFATQSYSVTIADLDNSNETVETISFTPYASKNFIYYSIVNGIIDREPISTNWDLTFMQYPSFDYDPPYTVAGILQNVDVEVAQVYPVNDVATYIDFSSATFESKINVIGYDWKTFASGWSIVDSTVYFVKDKSGSLWKVIMTGFTGSASGEYQFSKEKLSSAGLNSIEEVQIFIYPNPSSEFIQVVVDNSSDGKIELINQMGSVVYSNEAIINSFGVITIPVSHFDSGTYYIAYNTESSRTLKKVTIIH
jgi:hypothetical protein